MNEIPYTADTIRKLAILESIIVAPCTDNPGDIHNIVQNIRLIQHLLVTIRQFNGDDTGERIPGDFQIRRLIKDGSNIKQLLDDFH